MSTPRQPLPPEIYQRRRAAALVLVLVLVAVLLGIWFLTRGSAPHEDTAASSASATKTTPTPAASDKVKPSSSASSTKATPSPASSTQTTPGERKDSCALDDLIITASLDKPTYNAGEQPVMTIGVENPTAADCIINLDEDVMRFEVYDMKTYNPVWKDTDCFAPVAGGIETFKAGEKVEFEASWSRLQSAPDQCVARTPAPAGAYFLHTVIGQHPSEPQPFNLLDS